MCVLPYISGSFVLNGIHIMRLAKNFKSLSAAVLLSLSGLPTASATVVEVQTVLGNFEVNLFDSTTPKTVENFLGYVNSGAYFNNVVHRAVPGFVVQAGGFKYANEFPLESVTAGPAVENEPKLSNVRGTISMAKLGGQADSATSQWFINLADNSANLDRQNGGFSAFGQVLGDGMKIVDAIAALNRFNQGGALTSIPLRDYSATDASNNVVVEEKHLVLITDIVVKDAATNTHTDLQPKANTLINQPTNPGGGDNGGSSGGGSLGIISLLLGGLLWCRKAR